MFLLCLLKDNSLLLQSLWWIASCEYHLLISWNKCKLSFGFQEKSTLLKDWSDSSYISIILQHNAFETRKASFKGRILLIWKSINFWCLWIRKNNTCLGFHAEKHLELKTFFFSFCFCLFSVIMLSKLSGALSLDFCLAK